MKTKPKLSELLITLACTILIILFAGLFLESSNSRDNRNPIRQQEMTTLLLEWGRLAPFPVNAMDVTIKTEGNAFTRSFRASFTASKPEIQAWITASPGLSETTPKEISDNKVQYIITPGGGANRAEVVIDYNLNKVEIYVSWS